MKEEDRRNLKEAFALVAGAKAVLESKDTFSVQNALELLDMASSDLMMITCSLERSIAGGMTDDDLHG